MVWLLILVTSFRFATKYNFFVLIFSQTITRLNLILSQILSNDKFVSAIQRVVAKKIGPRISVACFFNGLLAPSKMHGPIEELISEENPPLYKDFQVVDYVTKFFLMPLDKTGLDLLRL